MRINSIAATAVAILLARTMFSPASAQDMPSQSPALGAEPPASQDATDRTTGPIASPNAPPASQHVVKQDTSAPHLGLFPALGGTLLDHGVDIHGIVFDHFLANPSAGIITGQKTNLAVISPAVDLDLGEIAGLNGGKIHIQETFFALKRDIPGIVTQTGGVITGFQTTPAPVSNVLSVLTFEQRLLDDRLSIEVGRSNIYRNFFQSSALDIFTGFSTGLQVVSDFNVTPYPVWSGRTSLRLANGWYLQSGIFEDNYRHAVDNGNSFGISKSSGVQIVNEVGYRSDFSTSSYPGSLEAGLEWNTRHGFTNIKGTGVTATSSNTAGDYPGGGVVFAQGSKVVWRGANRSDGPPANIAPYGAISVALDTPQPINFDVLAGVNLTGFLSGRPSDAIGIQAHYQLLSGLEARHETVLQNAFAGPGRPQPRGAMSFELVESTQVLPAIAVRPFVEYILHPDAYYLAAQRERPHDGFEVGALLLISLGRLLGTSKKAF